MNLADTDSLRMFEDEIEAEIEENESRHCGCDGSGHTTNTLDKFMKTNTTNSPECNQ